MTPRTCWAPLPTGSGVPVDDLLEGIDKRLAELRANRTELAGLRRLLAGNQAAELVAQAVDGVRGGPGRGGDTGRGA